MEEICRIADMRFKEVINVSTGERLGFVNDVEIDMLSGKIAAIIVPGAARFFGLLGREEDIIVPWEEIERVGDDIILTKSSRKAEKISNKRVTKRGKM